MQVSQIYKLMWFKSRNESKNLYFYKFIAQSVQKKSL